MKTKNIKIRARAELLPTKRTMFLQRTATQNAAIAEACGWKIKTVTQEQSAFYGVPLSTRAWFPPDDREWDDIECPDYLNDPNAMHEAVSTVINTDELKDSYVRYLYVLIDAPMPFEHTPLFQQFQVVNATAAQRAEAFLRTIGKWVEE